MSKTTVVTPFARLSYPHLFEPIEGDNGKKKYTCALLFPADVKAAGARLGLSPGLIVEAETAMQKLKRLAGETAVEFYGGKDKLPAAIRNQDLGKNSGWPFRDQAQKEGDGYEPGALFINVGSTARPGLVDRNMAPITDPSLLYAGCWVRASVTAFGFKVSGNNGISFGLSNIQKIADDDPISGRTRAEDDFQAIEGAEGAPAEGLFD